MVVLAMKLKMEMFLEEVTETKLAPSGDEAEDGDRRGTMVHEEKPEMEMFLGEEQ